MEQIASRLHAKTLETDHDGGRRKRKLLLKHFGCSDLHSAEVKKMITVDNSFIEGITIHQTSEIIKTEGVIWKCASDNPPYIITKTKENIFDEKIVHFEDYYGSWILDDNGEICLAKEYANEICINDTKTNMDNSLSSSCLDSSVISNSGSHQLCAVEEREQSNLSWLLNFKVDSLFKSEDVKHDHNYPNNHNVIQSKKGSACRRVRAQHSTIKQESLDQAGLCSSESKTNTRKYQEQSTLTNENGVRISSQQRKPPFTYSDLIERSLKESGELTVSGIYNWISHHFPYYKVDDDRWKNSVRHNLSINPHFRKGRKSSQGAGHLWCIATSCIDSDMSLNDTCHTDINGVTMDEVEAATASIEENKENRNDPLDDEYFFDENYCGQMDDEYTSIAVTTFGEPSLVQTAEQVLKGVKREVEVQFVMPPSQKRSAHKESDFLNPIPMEQVLEESGINYQLSHCGISEDGTSFLITEINPIALGINMAEGEIITTDILFNDDVSCFV